ncbi:unnamed protein product [Mucor fragilis]
MLSILPAHIVSSSFCFISSLVITYQVIKRPNKVRFSVLGYSILTLPASIVSTLSLEGIVSQRANSLVYLVSTFIMCITHFFMVLDVGYRLRMGEANWRHPLVLCGAAFSACTNTLLLAEIIILGINSSGTEEYPLKGAFIAGVICAIVAGSCVFTYTFMPLLYWREKRINEGHSRTTAIGIWFFFIQNLWYCIYGVLYVWFFVMNSWNYFSTLLAIDYALRFVENLLYTWPPPKIVIDYLSSKLPSTSINLSTRKSGTNIMSSEQYNVEENIEYDNAKDLTDIDHRPPSEHTVHSSYGSKVTIVTR